MRTALTRRTSAIALAGVLALGGAACGDATDESGAIDDGADVFTPEEPAADTDVGAETEPAG